MSFPGVASGKESACNAGDTSSTPRMGRFPGEGIGYPLQHAWASLVAQLVKIPPAMPMAPHSSTLAWKIPWTEEPGRLQSRGSLRVGHN